MSQYAPQIREQRMITGAALFSFRLLPSIAAILLQAGCAQSPPIVDSQTTATAEAVGEPPATVSIRDAPGLSIPELDPEPPPAPPPPPAATPASVSGGGNQFVCTPVAEVKAEPPKPKPARKPRPAARKLPEQPEPVPPSPAVPPPGSKLDNVRAIEPGEVTSLLGKKVWGPGGDDMGRIVDLLIEPSGQIRAAVIDFGGFLGVGNRKIAVNWNLLKVNPATDEKQVVLTLDRDQVLAAPEFKDPTHPAEVVAPAVKHGG